MILFLENHRFSYQLDLTESRVENSQQLILIIFKFPFTITPKKIPLNSQLRILDIKNF